MRASPPPPSPVSPAFIRSMMRTVRTVPSRGDAFFGAATFLSYGPDEGGKGGEAGDLNRPWFGVRVSRSMLFSFSEAVGGEGVAEIESHVPGQGWSTRLGSRRKSAFLPPPPPPDEDSRKPCLMRPQESMAVIQNEMPVVQIGEVAMGIGCRRLTVLRSRPGKGGKGGEGGAPKDLTLGRSTVA
jgi:hypothetical protein